MLNQHAKAVTAQRLLDENVRERLQAMEADPLFNTPSSYSANGELYPDHQIPFVEKHLDYLMNHPKLDSRQYLANLRLMVKKR